MSDVTFASPRLASGALFVSGDKILLVCKTYGNRWDLPGGYVEPGESPASACEREVREEIGLERNAQRLLVHDWAPNGKEGDKILYVFDCGQLGDEQDIQLDGNEIEKVEWVPVEKVADYTIPRLTRRLLGAYAAYRDGVSYYLEHGEHRFQETRQRR